MPGLATSTHGINEVTKMHDIYKVNEKELLELAKNAYVINNQYNQSVADYRKGIYSFKEHQALALPVD
jgi:hypothetical protein